MTRERPPADVGTKLQEARQRRGASLRQIADATKISVSVLQALERNDASALPGGVYARGFVRSFATAVGLDGDSLVAEFVAQSKLDSVKDGYPPPATVNDTLSPDIRAAEGSISVSSRSSSRRVRLAAVGLFAATLVVYIGANRRTLVAGPSLTLPAMPPPVPVQPTSVDVGSDSVTPPAAAAPILVPVSPAPANDSAANSPPADAKPSADADAPVVDRLAVVLSVTYPSWVIATVDGKKTVNRMLEVGEQETLEAFSDLVLTAGDAGALVMTLNGTVAKSLGRAGETVTARVDRNNFKDYLVHDDPARDTR